MAVRSSRAGRVCRPLRAEQPQSSSESAGEVRIGLGRRADRLQRLLALAAPLELGQEVRQQRGALLFHRVGGGDICVVEWQQLGIAREERTDDVWFSA